MTAHAPVPGEQTPVDRLVRERVKRHGPLPFAEVVEAALYAPDAGFYTSGGRAGRHGDFVTSPEVGPLFGAVVARALDSWWADMGSPPVFVVVEAGAGPGALARSVRAARPACARALRYLLVERSASQRALHGEHLALEDASTAFASMPEPDDDLATIEPPPGPIFVTLPELPRLATPCVVIANELLDNLPFGLLELTSGGWAEVRVGVEGDELVEVLVPTSRTVAHLDGAPVGARVPVQEAAAHWLADARQVAGPDGRVVVLDYASTTAELARRPWRGWVRTYRQHQPGGPPLVALGSQDITCEVALDQLDATPGRNLSQAEWLREHGIDDLVAEGRRTWEERAHIGDLEAVRARSRVTEAEALTDPDGLGGFRVLEWPGS